MHGVMEGIADSMLLLDYLFSGYTVLRSGPLSGSQDRCAEHLRNDSMGWYGVHSRLDRYSLTFEDLRMFPRSLKTSMRT
jgi:hypothetical protein